MENKETIWDEDYAKQTAGRNKEFIKKMTKEFNDRLRSDGIVTLREVLESLGFQYDNTAYATDETARNGRWQYGGSVSELHFEKMEELKNNNDDTPFYIEFNTEE